MRRILEALRSSGQILSLLTCETPIILNNGGALLKGFDVRD